MHSTIFTLLPLIMAVAANVGPSPESSDPSSHPSIPEAQAKYSGGGEIACCKNKEEIEADGILGNILAKGLLNNVLGVGDSACAKFSLIENLNILGKTFSFLKYAFLTC
jgi:hypothetical protein